MGDVLADRLAIDAELTGDGATDRPCRCRSRIMTSSPSLITVPPPPAKGRSIGDDSRRPASRGMPGSLAPHENWGKFKCHKWGEFNARSQAEYLEACGALLRGGTIVDATLIAASPSTKNEVGKRDPQMHSSKKRNQWYFGMKAHVGVDASSGLVHTAGVTSGNVHDAKVMDRLIRDDDTAVYGYKGYASDAKKRAAEAAGVLWAVKEKAKPGGRLTARQRARNHRFGKVRAKVEHVFRVVKCQFGYRKVRYRSIAKNGAQVFSLLVLANLYLARRTFASA